MNTNEEILVVIQAGIEGKTVMVRSLNVNRCHGAEFTWHEKAVDKHWDFANREYKVKPMSVEEYIELQLKNSVITSRESEAYHRGLRTVLNFIKENK